MNYDPPSLRSLHVYYYSLVKSINRGWPMAFDTSNVTWWLCTNHRIDRNKAWKVAHILVGWIRSGYVPQREING